MIILLWGFLGICVAALSAFFSAIGSRSSDELKTIHLDWISPRIYKRVIAPLVFSCGMILLSLLAGHFSWWFFLSIPAYIGRTFLDCYGDNFTQGKTWKKILARGWEALSFALCALTYAIPAHFMGIWVVQFIAALVVTVYWGIENPKPAALEDFAIHFANLVFISFIVC